MSGIQILYSRTQSWEYLNQRSMNGRRKHWHSIGFLTPRLRVQAIE